ncbi:MAG: hypothetical protein ACI9F9_001888 [Candidatus Paceibacteria bacterium]|jgi:hypothetical protein
MNPMFLIPLVIALPVVAAFGQPGTCEDSSALIEVSWKDTAYAGNALPDEVGVGPPAAVTAWADWCLAHEYQMTLLPDCRVLFITPEGNGKLKRELKLIKQTMAEFDELLPAPEREEVVMRDSPEDPGGDDVGGEIPEDPEGGLAGWQPADQEPLPYSWDYEWGSGTWPVDTETCVMFVVHNEKDYGTLVDALGEMEDYLKPWAATAKTRTGFVHEKPLVGAYIANAVGQEEWDPENELVHRIAQMLFVRRFASIQPYWLAQGFSWYLENEIRRSIYCFPYRSEFVFATEHTGWDNALRNAFNDRDKPLTPIEFTSWKRGKYEGDVAKVSYGLVGYIARYHPDAFTPFLEAMRLYALENSKEDLGNGSWGRNADYALSNTDQAKFMREYFGNDCFLEATEFFKKGKRYRPKKKK